MIVLKTIRGLLLFVGATLCGATGAAAEIFEIDPDHTEVRFTWEHLGMSRQGGRFQSVSGRLDLDPDRPEASQVQVTIPVSSLATGVKKLDELLISTHEYFDTTQSPDIRFRSTGVRMLSDKTGTVEGELTFNGITRPVVLDVKWNFMGEHPLQFINPIYTGTFAVGFSATTQLRRSDWGMIRSIPYVSDEIMISIETELHRVGGPAPQPSEVPGSAAVPGGTGGTVAGSGPDSTAPVVP